jgi:acyl carrier protein
MSAQSTIERIQQHIIKKFPRAKQNHLVDNDNLLEGGILDSMGVLELVEFIEAEFSITVSDEDLSPENFQTIERIASFVQQRIQTNREARI